MKNVKIRKNVEIYFILYLIALVLLLPDKKTSNGFDIHSQSQNNSILLEKNTLTFRFEIENERMIIRSFDSVNTIYIPSGIENKDVQFIIEDAYTSEKILFTTASNKYSSVFTVKKNPNENTVVFQWRPVIEKNIRSRVLTVKLQVNDKNANNPNDILESQFSINIVNESENGIQFVGSDSLNQLLPFSSTSILSQQNTNNQFLSSNSNSGIIIPMEQIISGSAGGVWKNKVSAFGGISLFSYSIKTRNSDGSQVKIVSIDSTNLEVQGIIPTHSESTVSIVLVHKQTKDSLSASFKVRSLYLKQPEYQENIYAEQKYVIQPNFPQTEGIETTMQLKVDGKVIEEKKIGNLYYSVPKELIGKTIVIERYVNNQRIEPNYFIKVIPFRNPQIEDIRKLNGSFIITVEAYGKLNGKENKIEKILSSSGEMINFEEKYGNRIKENEKIRQILEIPISRNTINLQSFKVVDSRGNMSENRLFP